MEQVTINASVNVKGGPLVKLSAQVKSDAYVVASLALAAGATDDVTVLPAGSTAALLMISALKDKDQTAAKVEVTPSGTADGNKLSVEGSLLVASPDVLGGLANGGPRKFSVKNVGADDVTVSILTAFNS